MIDSSTFLAVVNPAAGGGRCRKLVGPALDRLRVGGISLKMVETKAPGQATSLVRDAYAQGYRKFIAVGGDGTSYEVVNGLFPSETGEPATLAFLPLGTGNSFLRDFSDRGVEFAIEALLARRSISLRRSPPDAPDRSAALHQSAEHGIFRRRGHLARPPFQRLGRDRLPVIHFHQPGAFSAASVSPAGGWRAELDRRPCLFLTFSNSKFTGGTMMIAPKAEVNDGLIEYVRWGPIGRLGLIRNLPTLYDGTHINHPLAERRPAKRVDFQLDAPVDVMVDGEVLTLHCQSLDVLPAALNVVV